MEVSPLNSTKVKKTFINPTTRTYQCWEGFIAATTFLSTLLVTFGSSFSENSLWVSRVNIALDIFYFINIIIKFYVGYIHEGTLITNKKLIKRKYLHGEFWIDLISIIPFNIIKLESSMITSSVAQLLRVTSLRRLLRFYSLTKFFGKYEDHLGLSTKSIRSFKYFLIAFALIHCISCGWYMLACPADNGEDLIQCYQTGWAIQKEQNMASSTLLQRYIKCLYWATITATSTGYGDIHAVNSNEKWYSIASMLLGIGFFFGPILGYMASNLTNSDAKRARYTHRISVIKDHLVDQTVSDDVQKKVVDYYEHLWVHHQGIVKSGMFDELPMTFQTEISLLLNKHVLEKAPLFHNVGVEFMRMISLVIKPAEYLPQQNIFSKNDMRSTLFYIKKGSVEVLANDKDEKPVKTLKEGSFFGEVSLLLNIPRCASVQAATYCELLMLERSDLTKILKHFPEVSKQLYDVIERRCCEATAHLKRSDKDSLKERKNSKSIVNFTEENDTKKFNLPSKKICFEENGKFVRYWNVLLCVVVVIFAFVHSYISCYNTAFGGEGYGKNNGSLIIFGLIYIVDVVYLFDIFVQARLKIGTNKEAVIEDPKFLLGVFLRKPSMWFDLCAVLPLELFAFTYATTYDRWIAASLFKTNRILKLYKVFSLFNQLESNINISIANLRFIKLSFLITFFTHICACVWYLQACFGKSCAHGSWISGKVVNENSNVLDVYIMTLYWAAATMTSTGYGDITANSTQGEFIVLFVLVTGLLLYGYCLSNIAATLTNKLSPKVEFMGRINGIISFMAEQGLSIQLIERVNRYLGLVWRVHRGEAVPGAQVLMGDMPQRLQQEVSFEEMADIITKVPVFMNTDQSFVKLLSIKLITYVFMPGDTIVYSGDVGREMYLMRRGLVEVLSKDKSSVVANLGPGSYFGEVGLIFGEARTADVRAKTYCELAMLKKSDLDEVLVDFPLIERQLQQTSENRIVLDKIKLAAKKAGSPRKANRIDLIEKNKNMRKKSIFRRLSTNGEDFTEEELTINDELDIEFNAPYDALHPIAYFFSHFLLRGTIDPHGLYFRTWTGISVAFSCIYIFTLGLQIAFLQDNHVIWIVNYLFDVFFLVDIYIKFHVSFYNHDGVLVTHPTATAANYLRTNFLIDFLACLPVDLIILSSGNTVGFHYAKMNRVLHMMRVSQYFDYLDESMGKSSGLYRNIKFSIYMFLITHIFACGWFMTACPLHHTITSTASAMNSNNISSSHHNNHEEELGGMGGKCTKLSWAVQNGRNLGYESVLHQYITCMYWAASTTCSVGYGDVHAYLTHEMLFALICMIVGVVFYGYIIASAAASLANADVQRARYQQKLNTINRFLKEQNVGVGMKKRILGFYDFLWRRNRGVNLENLFQGLPISLQADITLSLYKDIIESVPLFQGTELGFTKMLSLYIKPLLVPQGEYIVRKGDIGEEMFFINKGIVEVVSEHENPIIFDTMSPGRFFGEISTIFKCPRTASIRTQTNADLYVLKKKDLDDVLSHYPQIRKQIIETAEERQRMVRERAEAAAKKKQEESEKKESEKENEKVVEVEKEPEPEPIVEAVVIKPPSKFQVLVTKVKKFKALIHDDFIIDVDSRFHHFSNLNCLLIFITYITTTYMATFQSHPNQLIVFNIIAEFFFFFEIYLKFHMVFISATSGDKVTSLQEISKQYWKGNFKFDIVANFPIQILCFVVPVEHKLQYYSYFNLLHILRLKNLNDWFSHWLKKLNTNVLLIRLGENLVQITVTLQLFACIWFGIACPGSTCDPDTWASHRPKEFYHPSENYVDSLYWALATMTSTGYGDIHATNDVEKVFATIVMVSGKLIFGFVLGNVASTMANVEALRVKFEERFSAVQSHMKDQNMPLSLQQRVVNFFQYIWRRNRGSRNENIFVDLPPCLHGEFCLELTGEFMHDVPFLYNCEVPFIRQISTNMKLVQFHENEFITRKGDIGSEMYFIKRGKVEVYLDNGYTRILNEGDFFGEESLVVNLPRKNTTKAQTHVDMFCLSNEDLETGFLLYPEEETRVNTNLGVN